MDGIKTKDSQKRGTRTFVTLVLRKKCLNRFPLNYSKQYINNIYNTRFPTLCVVFFNVENCLNTNNRIFMQSNSNV